MFDIGFTELLLCIVVALVVIGPEQLPETVRTMGLWIGRLKRSLRETRSEIERQIGADDIRRQLHNEEIMRTLEETRKTMEKSIRDAETAVDAEAEEVRKKRNYTPLVELPDHAHMDVNPPPIAPPPPSVIRESPAIQEAGYQEPITDKVAAVTTPAEQPDSQTPKP